MKRSMFLFACFFSITPVTWGQNYKLELHLKAAALITGEAKTINVTFGGREADATFLGIPADVELYYFLRPKLGVGVFYTSSLMDIGEFSTTATVFSRENRAYYQHYGLAFMYSTKREAWIRFNASAGILTAEQLVDFVTYKVGKSALGYMAGVGLVLKITRSINFNVFNVKVIYYPSDFNYFEGSIAGAVMGDSGFIFKFFRKK